MPGMHDLSMGNQASVSESGASSQGATRVPNRKPESATPMAIHPTMARKRPYAPPASREFVREQVKRAAVYFDLTVDFDEEHPAKIRKVAPLITHAPLTDSMPQPMDELPTSEFSGSLVNYRTSSSGSPQNEADHQKETSTHTADDPQDPPMDHLNNESNVRDVSQPPHHPKKLPFVDEGYSSFPTSQEDLRDAGGLTEEDLAARLISSDKLRDAAAESDTSASKRGDSFSMTRLNRNATAWRERTERQNAEKSRKLREATIRNNGRQADTPATDNQIKLDPEQPLSYTRQQVGILNIFGALEPSRSDCVSRRESYSSGESRASGSGTTLFSVTENGEEYDVEDLFYGSQESAINTESFPIGKARQEQAKDLLQDSQTEPAPEFTASSRCSETPVARDGKAVEKGRRTLLNGRSKFDDDLEAGARKLEAMTKMNERQKAGPKTVFIPRHEMDAFAHPFQQWDPVGPSPASNHKFYSPYGEVTSQVSKWPVPSTQQADDGCSDSKPVLSEYEGLQRSRNRTGGLAALAAKAGHLISNTADQDELELRRADLPIQPTHRSTTVTADIFQVDFSGYTKKLSQEEKDVIKRHEWLKERQRDLKTLKQAYIETARTFCVIGSITGTMELELEKIDELQNIVLRSGAHDKAKRTRVRNIKDNMVRRQTCDVLQANMEEKLGMIVSRKVMQQIEDDLKIVEEEMEVVGQERVDQSTKRHSRKGKPKKRVRFTSPNISDPPSQSRRQIPDGTVFELGEEARRAKPTHGSQEYRQSQRAAFEKSDAERQEYLRESLRRLTNPIIPPSTSNGGPNTNLATQSTAAIEQDAVSEVSEEDEGFQIYPGMNSTFAHPVSKPAAKDDHMSLNEINRLEEERQQLEAPTQSQPILPVAAGAPGSSQAPDPALAQEMLKRNLGIATQAEKADANTDSLTDTASDTTDSSDGFPEYVWQYHVFGAYKGIEGLAIDEQAAHGVFLHKGNAEKRVGEAVLSFSKMYKAAYAAALEAEDETRLEQLVKPFMKGRYDEETGEQFAEFPAASCRLWIEKEMVEAKTKAERELSAPAKIYIVRYERTMPDGSVRVSSLEDIVECMCAELANEKACDVMGDWYGEHMHDGYLAKQRDALELKVKSLGSEGWWDMEEDFTVAEGRVDKIRVWVEERRVKGARN